MAAQPVMRAQRLFQVHFADFAETRRAVQAFARHVHFERMVGFRDHRHARALNGDAVAELHVGEVRAAGFPRSDARPRRRSVPSGLTDSMRPTAATIPVNIVLILDQNETGGDAASVSLAVAPAGHEARENPQVLADPLDVVKTPA